MSDPLPADPRHEYWPGHGISDCAEEEGRSLIAYQVRIEIEVDSTYSSGSKNGGAHWNSLEEIRLGLEHEVGDVQNLATLIVDPNGRGLESHWQKSAQALLVGLILYALYQARSNGTAMPTLSGLDSLLSDPNLDIAQLWMGMFTLPPSAGPNCRIVNASGRDMTDRPEEEGGSVLSTAKSYLSLYRDPVVHGNIADSHFGYEISCTTMIRSASTSSPGPRTREGCGNPPLTRQIIVLAFIKPIPGDMPVSRITIQLKLSRLC